MLKVIEAHILERKARVLDVAQTARLPAYAISSTCFSISSLMIRRTLLSDSLMKSFSKLWLT